MKKYRDLKYNAYLRFKYACLGLRNAGYWQAHRRGGFNRWAAPWFNLSAVGFFGDLVRPTDSVLEYGSGNGTLWLADRCRRVRAVETDPGFVKGFFDSPLPENVSLELVDAPDTQTYETTLEAACDERELERAAEELARHPYFAALTGPDRHDVIVVDGRARVVCGVLALRALNPDGFIVFDNYDRRRYAIVHRYFRSSGAVVVPIKGMAPFNDIPMLTAFVFPNPDRLADIRVELRDY